MLVWVKSIAESMKGKERKRKNDRINHKKDF